MDPKDNISLRDFQTIVDNWIRTTGGGYFDALTNMAILAEETGEVARVIARTDGAQTPKAGDNLNLADELADVLWVTAALANQHNIDLTQAVVNNLTKKSVRDCERFNHRKHSES